MAVVKANAYGHGAIPVAKTLQKIGVMNFAVVPLMKEYNCEIMVSLVKY